MLHLDFETRSTLDLDKVGAWAYAAHPTTDITCMGFAYRGQPLRVLRRQECQDPGNVWAMGPGDQISAHNVQFEYAVYHLILHKRYGWPALWEPSRWSCTMARAAMCGLPLSLDELTRVLKCKTPKDLEGRRIMLQLAKPIGFTPAGAPVFDEDPLKYQRLYKYNANDVLSEMEVDALLPQLPPSEVSVRELDLLINRRGLCIDTEFAKKAAALSTALVGPLNEQLRAVTGGAVDKATQIQAFKRYLEANKVEVPYRYVQGVKKETLDKVGVTELLAKPDLPPPVRKAVEIRRQVSKTSSTAKYAKALDMVCSDRRVRGVLQYHGAHTGRWAGRLLQAHNFPQGHDEQNQLDAIEFVMADDPTLFQFIYGEKSLEALSDAIRGLIIAGPGGLLLSADYSAIEARKVFWLAGQESALATYRAGGSPYLDMGAFIYKRPITKKGDPREYDVAKRSVLGGGFGMGWERFRDNVYLETAKRGHPLRLSDEESKGAINGYRELYPKVPALWREIEGAAIAAVRDPARRFACCSEGRVMWGMSDDRRFLVCRLPSGRFLWYWKPSVEPIWRTFCKDPACPHVLQQRVELCPRKQMKEELHYWGSHPKTGEWCQLKTYGGALTENVVQASARDIMAAAMLRADAAGFGIVLTVHDEIVAEVKTVPVEQRPALLDRFQKVMCEVPSWAKGLPVSVEGWTGERYRK